MRSVAIVVILLLSFNSSAQAQKRTANKKSTIAPKAAAKPAPKTTKIPTKQEELSLGSDEITPTTAAIDPLPPISISPLNSVLYFVPHQKTFASATLSGAFGNAAKEVITGPVTATDEYDVRNFGTTVEVNYGVLPGLSIGANIGYRANSTENSAYRDTAGGVQTLTPELKDKGVTDPNLLLDYRLLDSSLVVDLAGALRLGVFSAERGTLVDTDLNGRADSATSGNAASGSYAVTGGARAGYKFGSRLNLIGGIEATYNFAGQITYKTNVGEYVDDVDAYVSFTPQAGVEYFVTNDFVLNPFVAVQFNPTIKSSSLNAGVTTATEQVAAKVYNIGLNGTYQATTDIAIRAGYTYSSAESQKVNQGVGGAPTALAYNLKDVDAHVLSLQGLYEF